MIPAPFDYHRPGTLEEAIGLLSRYGGEAKVLSGGMSLLPGIRSAACSDGSRTSISTHSPRSSCDFNSVGGTSRIRLTVATLMIASLSTVQCYAGTAA